MIDRRILPLVLRDLEKKMVFVAGPRQCGKTILAESVLSRVAGSYLNWDVDQHRRTIRASLMDERARLWVFDEIHKFPRWRNWLKGVFDLHRNRHTILVTGSARLDLYRRGGESLQGRYFLFRLHPFTLSEILKTPVSSLDDLPLMEGTAAAGAEKTVQDLLVLGGFPEPFLSGSETEAKRWRLAYGSRLIRQDIHDLTQLKDLDRLELLYDRLPETVGSVLSINNLREDLEVGFQSVRNWVQVFEQMYSVFRVAPFGSSRIKAVKKERKLYLWDWSRLSDPGARVENLVALHLLRLCHWAEDVHGEALDLRFFRSVVGHEIDFVLLRAGKPWMAIEVKVGERPLSSGLNYFLQRVKTPFAFQLHLEGTTDTRTPDINGCRVRRMPVTNFLCNLP